ncbi:hypothetical protein ZIOFF_068334 [Zingiber officinale]|uniref:dUTP diphosphatase n=1 Tax=Zingiber officinale TaxID=94328 RepID=A0A8J5CGJ0_ZINOF|nr:hypothetical protein ZIOFF_068334 [Zingiber officinale]
MQRLFLLLTLIIPPLRSPSPTIFQLPFVRYAISYNISSLYLPHRFSMFHRLRKLLKEDNEKIISQEEVVKALGELQAQVEKSLSSQFGNRQARILPIRVDAIVVEDTWRRKMPVVEDACGEEVDFSILTRGYEAWHNGEANLLITSGLVGRLSNNFNVAFAYEIQGVVDYFPLHGVNVLPGRSLSTRSLQGLNWVIQPTQEIVPMQPSEVNSKNLMDKRISLSFYNYTTAQPSKPLTYNEKDEEIQGNEDVSHIITVLVEQAPGVFIYQDDPKPLDNNNTEEAAVSNNYPFVLAHKLTPNAVIPIQRTPGAVGFDLVASEAQMIEPRGRGLVSTGLSLEIPWGSYERIAARSSAALKFGIDIGIGVIDSDYKGEILIMISNHSDFPFQINQGDCLAQIIFEQILLLTICEATSLSPTTRSNQGFGLPPITSKECKKQPIWDTLGEPSGKFDYYVNYALPDLLPDLELPALSWDDDTITTTPPIFSKLLPRDKHLVSVCIEDAILQQERSPENHAGTTSPWASVPRSMDLSGKRPDMADAGNPNAKNSTEVRLKLGHRMYHWAAIEGRDDSQKSGGTNTL